MEGGEGRGLIGRWLPRHMPPELYRGMGFEVVGRRGVSSIHRGCGRVLRLVASVNPYVLRVPSGEARSVLKFSSIGYVSHEGGDAIKIVSLVKNRVSRSHAGVSRVTPPHACSVTYTDIAHGGSPCLCTDDDRLDCPTKTSKRLRLPSGPPSREVGLNNLSRIEPSGSIAEP